MFASDLSDATVKAAQIGAQKLAIWRDSYGKIQAVEDRCPHRNMRLSLGFVRGDMLTCLYHGWRFDEHGQCRAIPAHPDITPDDTTSVTTFPAVDYCGIIWGLTNKTDTRQSPAEEWHLPSVKTVTPVRTLLIQVPLKIAMKQFGSVPGRSVRLSETTGNGSILPLLLVARSIGQNATQLHVLLEDVAASETCEQASLWAINFLSMAERNYAETDQNT
ncbi:Rieske (2Fe-2S) protein [Acetobacter oeni]|nr:Rieske (2Fe-2S) protein [Acetobacter oeni]MBB3884710.1 nitrite reductase/ring-hydroxylating ferredoxin subunit [Acetobacter oeni]NHO20658.1 Rieske 2Fe-2S domain-containing protein [Acetobacter oeni]